LDRPVVVESNKNAFPVRGWRAGSERIVGMLFALVREILVVDRRFPELLAGLAIETEHQLPLGRLVGAGDDGSIANEDRRRVPAAGMAVFQTMFSVSLHEVTMPVSVAWLFEVGPRHQGQSSARL